jgi:hypothetical protein
VKPYMPPMMLYRVGYDSAVCFVCFFVCFFSFVLSFAFLFCPVIFLPGSFTLLSFKIASMSPLASSRYDP